MHSSEGATRPHLPGMPPPDASRTWDQMLLLREPSLRARGRKGKWSVASRVHSDSPPDTEPGFLCGKCFCRFQFSQKVQEDRSGSMNSGIPPNSGSVAKKNLEEIIIWTKYARYVLGKLLQVLRRMAASWISKRDVSVNTNYVYLAPAWDSEETTLDVSQNPCFTEHNSGNGALSIYMNLRVPKWSYLLIFRYFQEFSWYYFFIHHPESAVTEAALVFVDAVNHVCKCFPHHRGYQGAQTWVLTHIQLLPRPLEGKFCLLTFSLSHLTCFCFLLVMILLFIHCKPL